MKHTLWTGFTILALVCLVYLGLKSLRAHPRGAEGGTAPGASTISEVEFKRYLESTMWQFQKESPTTPTVTTTLYAKDKGDAAMAVRFDWGSDGVRYLETRITCPPASPQRSHALHECMLVGGAISMEIQDLMGKAIDRVELPGAPGVPDGELITKDGWRVGYRRIPAGPDGLERLELTATKV